MYPWSICREGLVIRWNDRVKYSNCEKGASVEEPSEMCWELSVWSFFMYCREGICDTDWLDSILFSGGDEFDTNDILANSSTLLILLVCTLTESAAEIKRLKVAAKNTEEVEETIRKVEAEAGSLREMVANLTEGKVALITKVSSFLWCC